jgi:hypothetical protein
MMIPAVPSALPGEAEVRRIMRRVYPWRGRFGRMSAGIPVGVWYPWYFCPANIRMDTYVRSGMQASDLVAVDGARPLRERTTRIPAATDLDATDLDATDALLVPLLVPLRVTPEMATAEARELLQVIILNRNKLLKSHELAMKTPQLRYIQLWVIPLADQPVTDWLVTDPHFGGSYPLSRRREILDVVRTSPHFNP